MFEPIHLLRQDAARNMARYYHLELRPDLFGGVVLNRRWGRIGANGQSKLEWFADPAAAQEASAALLARKTKRGYTPG